MAIHDRIAARQVDADLPGMLPAPDRFPAGYSVVTVSGDQAAAAAADLTAIPPAASVDPPDCAPRPVGPGEVAAEVGTDNTTRSTITVLLTRSDQPLSQVREQVSRCATVHARHGAIDRTITTRMLPPPPLHADDTLAFGRTATGGPAGSGADPTIRTLLAQIGDVRIQTTAMTFGPAQPDTTGLDQVFTAAVAEVHRR